MCPKPCRGCVIACAPIALCDLLELVLNLDAAAIPAAEMILRTLSRDHTEPPVPALAEAPKRPVDAFTSVRARRVRRRRTACLRVTEAQEKGNSDGAKRNGE
jgi:hypothetical protein